MNFTFNFLEIGEIFKWKHSWVLFLGDIWDGNGLDTVVVWNRKKMQGSDVLVSETLFSIGLCVALCYFL